MKDENGRLLLESCDVRKSLTYHFIDFLNVQDFRGADLLLWVMAH